MPTLDWLNRDAAFAIAAQVPTRVLRPHRAAPATVGAADAGNLLIQGDNLEALKALLPFYRGRVKCIFIDPPYNTKSAIWFGADGKAISARKTFLDRLTIANSPGPTKIGRASCRERVLRRV